VLSTLLSRNPLFAGHVFSFDGVSGGALGAAGFAAGISMVEPKPRSAGCDLPPTRHEGSTKQSHLTEAEILSLVSAFTKADYLSPMVGAALFPDFLQRFNPKAAPELDRSRWLEYAVEQTGKVCRGASWWQTFENPFELDFFSFWHPAAHYPALVINARQHDRRADDPLAVCASSPARR
jgi:hypothetical protein